MSVFATLSRTLGYLPFPSLRSSFIRTDLLSFQTIWEQGLDAGLQTQPFDFLDLGVANERRLGRRLHELVTHDDRCRADLVLLQSNYSNRKVTISAFKQPKLSRLKRLRAMWKCTGHGNVACFSRWRDSSSRCTVEKQFKKPWTETAIKKRSDAFRWRVHKCDSFYQDSLQNNIQWCCLNWLKSLKLHSGASKIPKISGGACPRTP